MKIEANLEDIKKLCPHVTIISYNRGWFEVAEQDKKVHGYKKLRQLNDSLGVMQLNNKLEEEQNNDTSEQSSEYYNIRQHQQTASLLTVRGNYYSDECCKSDADDAINQFFSEQEQLVEDTVNRARQSYNQFAGGFTELSEGFTEFSEGFTKFAREFREFGKELRIFFGNVREYLNEVQAFFTEGNGDWVIIQATSEGVHPNLQQHELEPETFEATWELLD